MTPNDVRGFHRKQRNCGASPSDVQRSLNNMNLSAPNKFSMSSARRSPLLAVFGLCLYTVVLVLPASAQVEEIRAEMTQVHKIDLDKMLERRTIRVLVVYNKLMYFLDSGRQRGTSYEGALEFQKFINKKFKTGTRALQAIFIPVTRDQLIPKLTSGHGDIAIANLSITNERKQLVDFTDPVLGNVKELLVTQKDGVAPATLTDLSDLEVHVRESSSYYGSLVKVNKLLAQKNLPPIKIVSANENLEDNDLLEMVNAGLLPAVVVDGHKAAFWKDIFPNINIAGPAISEGGEIGWAIRKDSPLLKESLNEFIANNKKGSLFGNVIYNRYLKKQ